MLACVPVVMWAAQTVLLKHYRLPIRWRIDSGDAPPQVRLVGRIVTQLSLLSVVILFPIIEGHGVVEYYAGLMPRSRVALQAVQGTAAAVLALCILFGAWIYTDRIHVGLHQSRKKWVRRLVLLIPTACFGAVVEELVFRGIILADLLRTAWIPTSVSVAIGVLIFAGAHYIRTPKRRWTFAGHLALGLLLCIAFVRTQMLWLPIGLHAGGIFMIMGTRPFFQYQGPSWITGASIFPFAGVFGVCALMLMTLFVWQHFGTH